SCFAVGQPGIGIPRFQPCIARLWKCRCLPVWLSGRMLEWDDFRAGGGGQHDDPPAKSRAAQTGEAGRPWESLQKVRRIVSRSAPYCRPILTAIAQSLALVSAELLDL